MLGRHAVRTEMSGEGMIAPDDLPDFVIEVLAGECF